MCNFCINDNIKLIDLNLKSSIPLVQSELATLMVNDPQRLFMITVALCYY